MNKAFEAENKFIRLREEAVLFCLIAKHTESWQLTGEILKEEMFYVPIHRDAFRALKKLIDNDVNVDPISVLDAMDQFDSSLWMNDLSDRVEFLPSFRLLEYVEEMKIIHEARTVSDFLVEEAGKRKPTCQRLSEILELVRSMDVVESPIESAHSGLQGVYQEIIDREGKEDDKIAPTPFYELNSLLNGGFRPGEMIVLAGRPGMGKSALALCLARYMAEQNKNILYISLEMSCGQISQRLMSQVSGVPLGCIRKQQLSLNQLSSLRDAMKWDKTLYFCDHVNTIEQLRSIISKVKLASGEVDGMVIDYIQLFDSEKESENRQLEIAKLSRAFKKLSQNEDMPVIVLSQLNRSLEARKNKRPMLSDLRESGALEQDADIVLFVYRPWVYDQTESHEETELIIAKHRSGATGTIPLRWNGDLCQFTQ